MSIVDYQEHRFSLSNSQELKHDFMVVNRALRVLSACLQAVIRAADEATLIQTLCDLITEEAAYRMAWVGYVCHDEAKSVQPVAWAGHEADYLKSANITWADTERGQGPTGRVIRSGHPVACQNMLKDPKFAPWREAALQRGYQSSLVLPLRNNEEVFGTLNIYSAEADAFDTRELELLTELADSLSYGILALRVQQALGESEERYRLLAENINDLVCLHQPDGRYLYVSPSCEALLGYHHHELMGQDPYAFFHPDDADRVTQETLAMALKSKPVRNPYAFSHREGADSVTEKTNGTAPKLKPVPITYRMRQKSGNYIWFETLTTPIVDAQGEVVQLQTTSRDVTDRVLAQERLRHEALHDALTGLPNRDLLIERLEYAINRSKRQENYHFAVLFLDLDRFKVINDSLGHLAGDQLLIAIAKKLQFLLRETDLAVRMGGDEFVILLDEIKGIKEAIRATERIFAELRLPLMMGGREIYITTSIGIVFGTKDYVEASHLLRDADIAMYRAKNEGKARYEIFDPEMHRDAIKRLHLENDLRQGIEREEFILYYQPIVELATNQLVGFETLVRWQHPTEGLKSPGDFIAVAEETGLISSLDYWVLRRACQQLASWQTVFPNISTMKVSVNLSAQDLRRHDLLEVVDRVLAETGLPGNSLTLEITESMLIEDVEATINRLRQLKERGIAISIDDFGTGYSSLSYLHRLPVDNLKVDRSFVNQMQEGRRNHQIVETIVTLSEHLKLDTIAEGIETVQQLERLQELGYKFGQGYLFSKPLSEEATEALLGRKSTLIISGFNDDIIESNI
jgi:diguanylate cyclase (GGDEF)-like protein/PAS domain S-box-containing protein